MNGINKLLKVMADLRGELGCPWDKKQTMDSLTSYTLEETYELIDAILSGESEHIEEELGDVLFQIVFYAQIMEENQKSNFDRIAEKMASKLIERHPHVFADDHWDTDEDRLKGWEHIKRKQRQKRKSSGSISILDEIPPNLPSMLKGKKLQKRAASVNFDWPDYHHVLAKIDEELQELKESIETHSRLEVEEELGDLLFAIVNLGRHLKIDPEIALEKCNQKFIRRFQYIETSLQQQSKNIENSSLDEMETLWQSAKQKEKNGVNG